jgi:hypothetical protein
MLVARGIVTGAVLTQVLSHQLALPWVSLAKVRVDASLLALVPRDLAARHRVVPVHLRHDARGTTLYVATDDPLNEAALGECARAARVEVRPMVAAPEELTAAIALFYDGVPPDPPSQDRPPRTDSKGEGGVARGPRRAISVGAMNAVVSVPANRPAGAAVPPPPPPPLRKPPVIPQHVQAAGPAATPEVLLGDADVVEEVTPDPPSSTPAKGSAIILAVSAPLSLVRNCRMAAAAFDARVVKSDLASAAERARECSPFAVVVTETVYAFDRLGLSKLALSNGALLVIWSNELEAEYLEPLLATAYERWASIVRP